MKQELAIHKSFDNLVKEHPCYSETAHYRISRLHLPVAQKCNIRCNYCDRRVSQYFHTSRPGLAYKVIEPDEVLNVTLKALHSEPRLKVVGIAGPGEPLYNPETFETLDILHNHLPELQLCVCTNGLLLEDKLDPLMKNGVVTITVTLNAVDPNIACKIYDHINYNGRIVRGIAAAKVMVQNQLDGIAKAVNSGALVKINTVLIPDINLDHILDIATKAEELGVYIMNIMPLIPLGKFSSKNPPTCEQLRFVRNLAETVIPQFRLCRQCRADACGVPGLE